MQTGPLNPNRAAEVDPLLAGLDLSGSKRSTGSLNVHDDDSFMAGLSDIESPIRGTGALRGPAALRGTASLRATSTAGPAGAADSTIADASQRSVLKQAEATNGLPMPVFHARWVTCLSSWPAG